MDTMNPAAVECDVYRWARGLGPHVHAIVQGLAARLADVAPYGLPCWLAEAGHAGLVRPWGVLVARSGPVPVLAIPLAWMGAGVLTARLAPSGETMPLLVDPVYADAAFDALARWLRAAPAGIGVLDLGLWDDANLLTQLQAACAVHGVVCATRPGPSDMVVALPDSWDAYLAGLSKSARTSVRDAEKKLARDYPDMAISMPHTSAGLTLALDAQIYLYRLRWHDQPGGCAFDDARHVSSYRQAFVTLHEGGIGHLAVLSAAERRVVSYNWYQRADGPTVYCHLFARDTEAVPSRYSPGTVALAHLIRWAIARGARQMRLGVGDSPYKAALGGVELPQRQVVIARSRAALGLIAAERTWHAVTRLPVHLAYHGGRAIRRLAGRGA